MDDLNGDLENNRIVYNYLTLPTILNYIDDNVIVMDDLNNDLENT